MPKGLRVSLNMFDGKPRDAGGVYSNHKKGSIPCDFTSENAEVLIQSPCLANSPTKQRWAKEVVN